MVGVWIRSKMKAQIPVFVVTNFVPFLRVQLKKGHDKVPAYLFTPRKVKEVSPWFCIASLPGQW